MKLYRLITWSQDDINGLVIQEAEEVVMKDGMAQLALRYNNALSGGRYLSEEDFNKIYKPLNEQTDGKDSNISKRKPARRQAAGSAEPADTRARTAESED